MRDEIYLMLFYAIRSFKNVPKDVVETLLE